MDDLLAAVVAAPDDDLPRLIYADALDEQGDTDRAEFIRLQLASDPRADVLLARHRAEWIIPNIAGVQEFRRGFVDHVRTSTAEFLAHQDLLRRHPITSLRLPLAMDRLGELAAVPWLGRLRHLDLTGNVGLGPRLDEFFHAVELTNLGSLELRNCQLWPEHAGTLGGLAERWPNLTRLNLSGNPIGDDGLTHLVEPEQWSKLAHLILRCDELQAFDRIRGDGVAKLLHTPLAKQLVTLDLNGHGLWLWGYFLEGWPAQQLQHLDLGHNDFNDDAIHVFDAAFNDERLPQLRTLVYDRNTITRPLSALIAQWPRLATLDLLSLRGCGLDDQQRDALERSPYRDKLRLE